MAKRKKGGGSKRKHRRISGVTAQLKKNEDILVLAGGVLIGGVAKGFLDQTLAKQETLKLDQKLVDGLEVAAGVAGAIFLEGPLLKGIAIGLGTSAAYSGLRGLGVIKGIGMPMVPFRPRPIQARYSMNGATQTPAVAGANVYGFPQPPGVGRSLRRKMSSY